jgi:hypothetical protein
MSPLLAFAIKLPLALIVFLLIAYAGTTSKRIAGVLFTFPILNGIAIIASDEPVVVANAIYPLVIFNCVLFAALLTWPTVLPPVGRLPRWGRLLARVLVWSLVWLAGAVVITDLHSAIPGGGVLLAGSAVFACVFMLTVWSGIADNVPSPDSHIRRFMAFWGPGTGFGRIVFFVIAYGVVFWAARTAVDQKWVGMASALPLPGFFALATLIDDAEEKSAPMTRLRAIRDTLFLGPCLVIPFNWTFSHAMMSLPDDEFVIRYALLLGTWAVAALIVCSAVPAIAGYFDRRKS